MDGRSVAAWAAACLFVVLSTTNPAYKVLILGVVLAVLFASAGLRRMRPLLVGVGAIASFATLLNFASAHLGTTVLFSLPSGLPAVGGPYTLEALVFGASGGLTIATAVLAASPFSLLLQPHEVVAALPRAFSRTGTAVAASMNLVPAISRSFVQVSEAQRFRGWRPRGPRSWAEVVVPVVLTSVENSLQLAESMEARGFASAPRTSAGATPLGRADWLVVAGACVAAASFGLARLAGWAADWQPYPTLALPAIDARAVLACLFLLFPVVAWRRRG